MRREKLVRYSTPGNSTILGRVGYAKAKQLQKELPIYI